MNDHAYRRPASGTACEICGAGPGAMVHLLPLPMMETAEREREEAKAMMQRLELEEQMRRPIADVSRKAGEIERNSPLFFGTGDNPGLF